MRNKHCPYCGSTDIYRVNDCYECKDCQENWPYPKVERLKADAAKKSDGGAVASRIAQGQQSRKPV